MHKKILLAEQSDATRGVAETVLRQNGFEVISVATGEKALEVLSVGRPDLIIAGVELPGHGHQTLHQCLQSDTKTRSIPLLLLADDDNSDLPYPAEIIIRRPVDSRELAERAKIFSGQSGPTKSPAPAGGSPLAQNELDDEFLDAALGLDQIDVTESEVLNQTKGVPIRDGKSSESDIANASNRVESIIITEDQTDIRRPKTGSFKVPPLSSSGKLDILGDKDQYGVQATPENNPDADHDYEWFINEMQSDSLPPSTPQQTGAAADSEHELTFVDPSSSVDPITPVGGDTPAASSPPPDGVDKFINEFKREVERFRSGDSKPAASKTVIGEPNNAPDKAAWEETFEHLTPPQVELFTQRMAKDIGKQIARMIINKIDSEKLTNMIKDEILARIKPPSKE